MHYRLLVALIPLLLIAPWAADAATRLAVASGGSGAGDCTVTACTPQRSLDVAVAGDIVTWANGTYTGNYVINFANGSSGNEITLKATNLHGAIIQGNNGTTLTNTGLTVSRTFWIIEQFQFTQHRRGIRVLSTGDEAIIRKNLIYNWNDCGICVEPGGDSVTIEQNVVGQGFITTDDQNGYGGIVLNQSHGHTVERNVVYSVGNNHFIQVGSFSTAGYGIRHILSNNNMVRGNVFIDGTKGTGLRCQTFSAAAQPGGPWCTNNTFRDNIVVHGQGAGVQLAENNRDSFVLNNLFYGTFFSSFGGKGNDPGGNDYQHNTTILTDYSWMGSRIETDDALFTGDLNPTLQSNLFFSTVNVPAQRLQYVSGNPGGTRSHNLFWSPVTPSSNWFSGYTVQGTDQLLQPTFVNAPQGNYTLAAGSPGKANGHDSTDRGVTYNSFLTAPLANNAINLPVQEWTNPGGSVSNTFTVTAGHWYQAFAYIPDTGFPTSGTTVWNVEGGNSSTFTWNTNPALTTAFGGCCNGWVLSNPLRWVYLGTRLAGDTSFTISWPNANSTGKLRIRQMPTPASAYQWLVSGTPAPAFTFSASTPVLSGNASTLTWSAVTDATTCTPSMLVGTDTNWTTNSSAALIAGGTESGVALTGPVTYRMSCIGAGGTTTIDAPVEIGRLVGHWALNDGSGTTADDSSVEANDGTLCQGLTCPSAGATWTATGQVGGALIFDGVNDHVRVLDDPILDFDTSANFTIGMWVRSTQAAALNTWPVLLDKSAGNTTGYQMTLHSTDTDARWYGSVWIGGVETLVRGGSDIANGTWNHLLFMRQGTSLTTYQNCAVANTATVSTASLSNASNLHIAGPDDNNACCYTAARIDDVKIWNYALSAPEITALCTADTLAPSPPTGLQVTGFGTDFINLAWTQPTTNADGSVLQDLAGTQLLFCTGAACTPTTALAPDAAIVTTSQEIGLTPGIIYRYKIKAFDEIPNLSADSNVVEQATTSAAGTLALSHWRIHGIGKGEGLDWRAPEDTAHVVRHDARLRLRLQIENTGVNVNQGYRLQCDVDGAASWSTVSTPTCNPTGVCLSDSGDVTHGSAATRQLTLPGGTSYAGGAFVTNSSLPLPELATDTDEIGEVEFELAMVGIADGSVVCCRPVQQDLTVIDYPTPPNLPCLTVYAGSASVP